MVSEMVVKGKDSIEPEMVYQGKACTVSETQFSVFNFSEDILCCDFNNFCNSQNVYAAFLYLMDKSDCNGMAASHLKKRICFIKHIIRGIKYCLSFLEFDIDGLSLFVVLVIRNGEGAEGAGVNKDLQSIASPYRYLS